MLTLLVLCIGIAIPGLLFWLLLTVIEGTKPVLTRAERWIWSAALGPTFMMFIVFVLESIGMTNFSLPGFFVPAALMMAILGLIAHRQHSFSAPSIILPAETQQRPRWMNLALMLLLCWTALKIGAATFDAFSVPTYWDDSFNNWNMRGKMFYELKHLELKIPIGNGQVQDTGVSSYPVSLPLIKAWLSDLRGSWQEPVVNGVQVLWLITLLASFYLLLLRKTDRTTALIGVYALASLPLLLIHGTNPYGDIFLASHLFIVTACFLSAADTVDEKALRTWIKLFALSFGLLLLSKNEATVIYAPILGITFLWMLWSKKQEGVLTADVLRKLLALCIGIVAMVALPWIVFKWLHGLTFGNAKSIGQSTISFNPDVVSAIWHHLTHEANWLPMPLVFPLSLLIGRKYIRTSPLQYLTFFVVAALAFQCAIFVIIPALHNEALFQTGLSRGFLHVMPVALLLVLLLWKRILGEK